VTTRIARTVPHSVQAAALGGARSVYRTISAPSRDRSLLAQPYDAQSWSVFAAKWVVPFALYHLAGSVFDAAASLRRLEIFALVVLGYLCVIAILFLCGAKALICPRFILDESLGIHADRARGPFLQAVANGVTLNLLGLIALDSFRRGRLKGLSALLFLIALPLAVLATRTRAVWLSFAGCIPALIFLSSSRRVRRACLLLILAGGVGLLTALSFDDTNTSFFDRLEERSPVEFRVVMYQTGLEMFLEKPLAGWGTSDLQSELAKRVHDFHQSAFFFHNTYLEIAVQHGMLGLILYLWIVIDLFRVGGKRRPHAAAWPRRRRLSVARRRAREADLNAFSASIWLHELMPDSVPSQRPRDDTACPRTAGRVRAPRCAADRPAASG